MCQALKRARARTHTCCFRAQSAAVLPSFLFAPAACLVFSPPPCGHSRSESSQLDENVRLKQGDRSVSGINLGA